MDSIAILDFGSQYSQLIARRVRELGVYCQLFPHDARRDQVLRLEPKGLILSGGPHSVYEPGAPQVPEYVLESRIPVLGICYGMQALTHALGGRVAAAPQREYGRAEIRTLQPNPLLRNGSQIVWMSHGDRIEQPPDGFQVLAQSDHSPIAAMGDPRRYWYGLQFHPEVAHTPAGADILRAFLEAVCGAVPEWQPESIISQSIDHIRQQVGDGDALAAVSGGVDSSVATALAHRALGDRLTAIFVNTGLMRAGEPELVASSLGQRLGANLIAVDATETFFAALQDVVDPEAKRRIIGEQFIRVFEQQAGRLSHARFLVQGTIYPDVIESRGPERQKARRIKTHHNVGGLPEDLNFELVEPLRYLFKDEVRRVGLALGLPGSAVWRQPFPGPGLAVRCLGEVTLDRVERLRAADRIVCEELERAGMLTDGDEPARERSLAQAFAVLLPLRTVGVMGDNRTFHEVVAIRAVSSDDFMTADWARLSPDLLARISGRITNEVPGVNRVVYDITSKPPATIEWE